ncbi:hypothetical protein NUU61_005938 [Penicillium alfredii]|uniref:Uncharacterized protein n=1 Tax=Penicillium alfredii TaxID=1506179 RepID=A0A9W9F013_9EURO|nr:uncharacterized protein NUU61_005938 [Penicillium alfredii]KAJ5091068.1 hypothetical protein NUU61_005938 [Penicillium alfredii]
MIPSTFFTFSTLLFLLASAWPQPQISRTPITECSALPKYNDGSKIAGPWTLKVHRCSDATASQTGCKLEGLEASCDVRKSAEDKGIQQGVITISSGTEHAKVQIRCNGALQTLEARVPSGAGAGARDWHALVIDEAGNSGELAWGLGSKKTGRVQVYRHTLDHTALDGLFLGSHDETSWVLSSSGSYVSNVDHMPYWSMRLSPPTTKIALNEYRTFIRIE